MPDPYPILWQPKPSDYILPISDTYTPSWNGSFARTLDVATPVRYQVRDDDGNVQVSLDELIGTIDLPGGVPVADIKKGQVTYSDGSLLSLVVKYDPLP
jgi:hypothetical protein